MIQRYSGSATLRDVQDSFRKRSVGGNHTVVPAIRREYLKRCIAARFLDSNAKPDRKRRIEWLLTLTFSLYGGFRFCHRSLNVTRSSAISPFLRFSVSSFLLRRPLPTKI